MLLEYVDFMIKKKVCLKKKLTVREANSKNFLETSVASFRVWDVNFERINSLKLWKQILCLHKYTNPISHLSIAWENINFTIRHKINTGKRKFMNSMAQNNGDSLGHYCKSKIFLQRSNLIS